MKLYNEMRGVDHDMSNIGEEDPNIIEFEPIPAEVPAPVEPAPVEVPAEVPA